MQMALPMPKATQRELAEVDMPLSGSVEQWLQKHGKVRGGGCGGGHKAQQGKVGGGGGGGGHKAQQGKGEGRKAQRSALL